MKIAGVPSTHYRFAGNVSELRLATTDEVREKFSSVESAAPLLKRVVARRTMELIAVMDEYTMENLSLAMMGALSSAAQSVTAVTNQAVNDVLQGRYYDLGSRNIAAVVVNTAPGGTLHVVDVDYTVDLVRGILYIIPGGGIADNTDLEVDFTRATATTIETVDGGGTSVIEAKVLFESDNANGPNYKLQAWRVSITPEGELGFIGDDFGNFSLRMAIQNDGVNHPTNPNYVLQRFTT